MSQTNYLGFRQQYAFAFDGSSSQLSFGDCSAGEEWSFDHGYGPLSSNRTANDGARKDRRALEKNVAKMRKEWTKVKEEMGHLKQHGMLLSETLTQTDRKVALMLLELEQVDEYMKNLMAQNDN